MTGGRAGKAYMSGQELAGDLRAGYARVLGLRPGRRGAHRLHHRRRQHRPVRADLRPGDEIVTSDEEHPGLLAPLGRLKRLAGVTVTRRAVRARSPTR